MTALRPTLPGKVEGIVGLSPCEVQCSGCGYVYSHPSTGLAVLTSGVRFHPAPWTTGHKDNPRLCRPCRQARGCRCYTCENERQEYRT